MTPLARFFTALAKRFDKPDAETSTDMLKRIQALEAWRQHVTVQIADVRVQVAKVHLAAGFETFTTVRPDEV